MSHLRMFHLRRHTLSQLGSAWMPKVHSDRYSRVFQEAHQHSMSRNYHHGDRYDDGGSWRGRRGRGGGGRGRGRGRDYDQGTGDGDDRGRPPPGLKGREIGMWYAKRGKAKKEQQERMNRPTVAMDRHKEDNIRRLLHNIKQVDEVPPQVFRDFDGPGRQDSTWWDNPPAASSATLTSGAMAEDKNDVVDNWEDLSNDVELTEEKSGSFGDRAFPRHGSNRDGSAERGSERFPDDRRAAGSAYQGRAGEPSSSRTFARDPSSSSLAQPEESGLQKAPSQESIGGADAEGEMDEDVPQVVGVLQYDRAHGDIIYLDEEMGEEFSQDPEFVGLQSNSALDERLAEEAQDKTSDKRFQKMLEFRKKLPSYKMRNELVDLIRDNQAVVISGETGCGKTTQVPQFILDDYISRGEGSRCHIICTQPRRISAVSVAERVSSERCEKCGGDNSSVGYQIRLEVRHPRKQGSMLFCTTGIVLKFLEGDPLLQRATHIILDEIHERDLQSDFLMIILKDLLPRRPDLKVILMSATLNAEMFSKYFFNSPMINIPGFTFPVQEFLLEDVIQMTGYTQDTFAKGKPKRSFRRKDKEKEEEEEWNYQAWLRNLDGYSRSTIETLRNFDYTKIDLNLIVELLRYIVTKKEDGAILVFVPGWEEISNLHKLLQADANFSAATSKVIPLHSLMPTVNQREVFDRPPPGIRKIVIATNIAETSITIDDVVFVVDSGKIKVKDYDPESNLTCLEPKWVARANSRQRRGRAGRVQAGYCYHLYTSLKWNEMIDYIPPEMLRTRLEELCLQIKLLKLGRIEPFVSKAMQPPSMEALHKAIVTLQELNALDHEENLLPLGVHLARMPVEPHTGKMILFGAMFCCLDPILTVAASLSFKDAFFIPLGKEKEADAARKDLSEGSKSDHLVLINAMKGWERSQARGTDRQFCWDHFLSPNTLKMLRDMKRQLAEMLCDLNFVASRDPRSRQSNIHSDDQGLVKAVLCAGLYPHVAKVAKTPKPGAPPYKMVSLHTKDGKGKVSVHPKSVNSRETSFESKWLIYYHMLKTTQVYVHDCTMVSPYPLLFFGGDIKILMDSGQECISVDDWIVFKASRSTAQLVKDLRRQLDRLLEEKIVRPGVTNWNENEKEGALMRAIADLISTEETEGGGIGEGYDSHRGGRDGGGYSGDRGRRHGGGGGYGRHGGSSSASSSSFSHHKKGYRDWKK